MSENEIIGSAEGFAGKAERAVGNAIGDNGMQARGATRQFKGKAREVAGRLQHVAENVRDSVGDRAVKVGDQARVAYDRAQERAREVAGRVDPFVKERPYASIGITLGVGLLIGLLLASHRPRVVYIKPRD